MQIILIRPCCSIIHQVCDKEKDEPKVCMTSDAFREFRRFKKHLKSIPEAGGG